MAGSFAYGRLSWDFGVVPLHVYSAKDLYLSKYLPLLWTVHNIVHAPASGVRENRHAAVILQREGSGDHLPREMRQANEKQHTNTVGYFTKITRAGVSCGYLDNLQHKNISLTSSCTVRCFGNILHLYNTIICHVRLVYIWNSVAMHESRLSCHTSV